MKSSIINATFFFVLFSLVIAVPLNAQSNKFLIGATAGVNFSKFKFSGELDAYFPNTKSVFGINGGVNFGVEFNRLALLSGVHYVKKGSKYSSDNFNLGNGDVGFEDYEEKQSYLTIPLLLRYRAMSEDFGVTLSAGPTFNIGLNSNIDYRFTSIGGEKDQESFQPTFGAGIDDPYKKLQMGFIISPGVFCSVGETGRFGANIVFDFALTSSFNDRFLDAIDFNGEQRNSSVMLTLTYEHTIDFGDNY